MTMTAPTAGTAGIAATPSTQLERMPPSPPHLLPLACRQPHRCGAGVSPAGRQTHLHGPAVVLRVYLYALVCFAAFAVCHANSAESASAQRTVQLAGAETHDENSCWEDQCYDRTCRVRPTAGYGCGLPSYRQHVQDEEKEQEEESLEKEQESLEKEQETPNVAAGTTPPPTTTLSNPAPHPRAANLGGGADSKSELSDGTPQRPPSSWGPAAVRTSNGREPLPHRMQQCCVSVSIYDSLYYRNTKIMVGVCKWYIS